MLAPDPLNGLRDALRTTRPDADLDLLRHAYDISAHCHRGQFRYSGDPYITHPVTVATILAGLGADDKTLCAAILHDTVEDTPYTLNALSREFGPEIAGIVAGIMALDTSRRRWGHKVARTVSAVESADTRVVAMKLADRLHNMQTIRFVRPAKQVRKAREVLDIFVPVGEQFQMHAVAAELETLASATLTRHQLAGHGLFPALVLRQPLAYQRTIVALDIENSTSRSDPVKAELRKTMYELFGAALHAAGIHRRHRDRFADRGDGLLALIHPVDHAPRALLNRVIPAFGLLLAEYNAGRPPLYRLRVRVVVHAGLVHYDADGCFGEALDTAFRLLDATQVKTALRTSGAPIVLVVSTATYRSVHPGRIDPALPLVSVQVAGQQHEGLIHASYQRPGIPGCMGIGGSDGTSS